MKPHERAGRLEPWFGIANRANHPPLLKLGEVTFDLRQTPDSFDLLRQSVRGSLKRIVEYAERRRTEDPGSLERYRRANARRAGTINLVWNAEGGEFWDDL